MTREEYINILELDNAELKKENQELKSQLSGTTHCFDEEEHNKLKEENQELKKQLHEASLTIQEMTEQDIECPSNCEKLRQLKKQLEEINKFVCKCGFANIEQVMLNYCGLLTQQKEFIKYLENEIKEIEKTIELLSDTGSCRIPNLQYKKHILEETLQKYKEITQTKNNNSV